VVDVQAIIDRGREMGLVPKSRDSVRLDRHRKEWRDMTAGDIKPGDIWVGHGLVDTVDDCGDGMNVQIRAGDDGKIAPLVIAKTTPVRVFR